MTKFELDMLKFIDEINERKIRRKLYRFLDGLITFIAAAGFLIIPFCILLLCKIFMK